MKENLKCLQIEAISPVIRNGITLVVRKDNGLVDLNPFFEEMLCDSLQSFLGYMENSKLRKTGSETEYNFSMKCFAEHFFGKYSPKEISSFLEEHLIEDDFSEEFLEYINNFEKNNLIAFPTHMNNQRGQGYFYFLPLNFSRKELDHALKETLPKKAFTGRRHYDIYAPTPREGLSHKREDFSVAIFNKYIYRIAEEFSERKPRIILPDIYGARPKLNLFEFIHEYNLPTENLKISRK